MQYADFEHNYLLGAFQCDEIVPLPRPVWIFRFTLRGFALKCKYFELVVSSVLYRASCFKARFFGVRGRGRGSPLRLVVLAMQVEMYVCMRLNVMVK